MSEVPGPVYMTVVCLQEELSRPPYSGEIGLLMGTLMGAAAVLAVVTLVLGLRAFNTPARGRKRSCSRSVSPQPSHVHARCVTMVLIILHGL